MLKRRNVRFQVWKGLNILVAVATVLNVSMIGAFMAPKVAVAASIGSYDQCSNDDGDGYASGDTGCRWTNGNLQSNNSLYFEGDSTVQRVWLDGFVPGSSHTVTLQYGTTKQGKHAYDFLTTWNASENWVTEADLCQDITGCATADASENSWPIPADPNGSGQFETGTRNFVMRGGALTGATTPVLSGSYAADSETTTTVSFDVASTGDMCTTKGQTTTCAVAMFFGAHIAKTAEWQPFNGTTGATSISGSPYHVALEAIDGDSSGRRDNQMQAGAIFQGNVIIEKQTVPDGSTQSFGFTSQTAALTGSLTDGGQIVASLNQGTYSVTETATPGWTLSDITCTDPTSNSSGNAGTGVASINVASGETVKCVYTNTRDTGSVELKKVWSGTSGSTTLNIGTSANGSQVVTKAVTSNDTTGANTVTTGTYYMSETGGLSNYDSSLACTDNGQSVTPGANDSLTVAKDHVVVCTYTNTRHQGTIELKKVWSGTPGSTTLNIGTTAGDDDVDSENIVGANGTTSANTVDTGTYYVSETGGLNDYDTDLVCTDNGQSVTPGANNSLTVAKDHAVVCTYTNTRHQGTIELKKDWVGTAGSTTLNVGTSAGTGNVASKVVTADDTTGPTSVDTGTYYVSESSLTDYATTLACTDNGQPVVVGQNDSVAVANGHDVVCTYTNTRDQGTIELKKEWSGIPGSTTLKIGTTAGDDDVDSENIVSINGTTGANTVDTGTYYVSEDYTGLSDYDATLVCTDDGQPMAPGRDGSVTVANGHDVVCTYTNTRQTGDVTVFKQIRNPENGSAIPSDWTFTLHANQQGLSDVTGIKSGDTVNVPTGFYTVSESGPSQYSFVYAYGDCSPDGDTIYLEVTTEGATCTFINETYAAHGQKFNDQNANSVWDQGEPALNGWTIFLDANLNGLLDLGERSMQTQNHTAQDGWYWFNDLPAGTYQICEVGQNGWQQTYPQNATNCHTMAVGQSLIDQRNPSTCSSQESVNSVVAPSCDFGNRLIPVTTISLDKTGPATATVGSQYSYTLTWGVNGNTDATNAVITDPIPANTTYVSSTCGTTTPTCTPSFAGNVAKWELGTRAPGASGTVTVTVQVSTSLTTSTTLTNTGTFDTEETGPVSDTVETRVSIVLGATTPELTLTKAVDKGTVSAGDEVTYTMVISNIGDGEATNVVLTDDLPAGFTYSDGTKTRSWTIGTLAAGASTTTTVTVQIDDAIAAGAYTNHASVTSDELDTLHAYATVNVRVPQVLGLSTTGAGPRDYAIFSLGLLAITFGLFFLRRKKMI